MLVVGLPRLGCPCLAAWSGLLCLGFSARTVLRAHGSHVLAAAARRRSGPRGARPAGRSINFVRGRRLREYSPGRRRVGGTSFLRRRYVLRARRGLLPCSRAPADAAPSFSEPGAADPVLGRSVYSSAAGQRALALVSVIKTGFASRFNSAPFRRAGHAACSLSL